MIEYVKECMHDTGTVSNVSMCCRNFWQLQLSGCTINVSHIMNKQLSKGERSKGMLPSNLNKTTSKVVPRNDIYRLFFIVTMAIQYILDRVPRGG